MQASRTYANFFVRLHDFFDSGERKVVISEVRRLLHLLPLLIPEMRQLMLQLLSAMRRLLLRLCAAGQVSQSAAHFSKCIRGGVPSTGRGVA